MRIVFIFMLLMVHTLCWGADQNNSLKNNGIFIGLTAGYHSDQLSQDNKKGNLELSPSVSTEGASYGVEAGYRFSPNSFLTLQFQKFITKDYDLSHLYTSANYQFDIPYIQPFIGGFIGVSDKKWTRNFATAYAESSSNSFMFGPQIGAEIKAGKRMSYALTYQYIWLDHKAELYLLPDISTLDHKVTHHLNFSVRYNF